VSLDIALARFDGEGTAVRRFATAKARAGADARWPQEVGFVEHHSRGKLLLRGTFAGHYLDVDEGDHVSQRGAAEGALAAGVLGTVLLGPAGLAVGLALGGTVGSQTGKPSDTEAEPEPLTDRLRAAVPRSGSAIVLIASPDDVDAMLAALGEDADVVRQSLSAEQERALASSLGDAPSVPPPAR
jgi:uncharacterized membrane protein